VNCKVSFARLVGAAAALGACSLLGCASCGPEGCYGGISGWSAATPCHGHVPTCWRPWPAECPPCPPPYGVVIPDLEPIARPLPSVPPEPAGEEPLAPDFQPPIPDLEPPTLPMRDDDSAIPRNFAPLPPADDSRVVPLPASEPVAEHKTSSRRRWVEAAYAPQPLGTVAEPTSPSAAAASWVTENPFIPAQPENR
jgi:hypothetical protein